MSENEAGPDQGDEDIFEGYFIQRAGINLNYLFFPGLIVHEFAHYLGCILAGVHVYEVMWWSPKGGHVVHQRARGTNAVIISLAPFFLNNSLALLFLAQAFQSNNSGYILPALFFGWLGFSLGIYAIPSAHDLRASLASLHRSYRMDKGTGNPLVRLFSMLVYPVWFILQYIIVYLLLPISKFRSLRLMWAAALVLLLTTTIGTTLLL